MLKSYKYKLQISLNGADWCTIDHGNTELREEHELEKIFIENHTFLEAHEWMLHHWHNHWSAGYTLFKKRPKIKIQYGYYTTETYTKFDTISIRAVYEERQITMRDLQYEDVEAVIQYLKERGITTCPMNF
jgi:hypothetical protein